MTTDTVGGVWRYALDLARSLSLAGCSVAMATLGPRASPEQREEAAGVADLIETGAPLDWLAERPKEVGQAAEAVADVACDCRADMVQLNAATLGGLARFPVPVVALHHSCLTTWWSAVKHEPAPDDWRWRHDLTQRHLRAVMSVAAPSRAFGRATAAAYTLTEAPRTILNGRPWPETQPAAAPAACLMTAGRLWDEGKNVATLDRAAGRLATPVHVAGALRGPNGAEICLRSAIPIGCLSDSALRAHFSCQPIFVSCALYEPFGLAVLEAAQAGCALILSDIATFRELWSGAAIFVDPHDDAGLAHAAGRLLSRPAERRRLGEAARRRARRYSIDACASATMLWHRETLARWSARENAA